ncbi:MAG: hypothetical protein GF331_25930, partial [Chitinivibrionales bacterium]|nr:hypothetical protein [Chitinivibrionales bacterium]
MELIAVYEHMRRRGMTFACAGLLSLFCMGVASAAPSGAEHSPDAALAKSPQTGNPVVVRGTYVDDTHIRLTLSGFCQLQTSTVPFEHSADYVGIWYQTGAPAASPDTAAVNLARFDVAALKAAAGCPAVATIDTVITVPALALPDSVYYLRASVVWRNPYSVEPFVPANGDSVVMRDLAPPVNVCSIRGTYPGARSDSAYLDILGIAGVQSDAAHMRVFCSFDPAFADIFYVRTLPIDSLRATGTVDSLRLVVSSSAFDGVRRMVYCAVVLVSGSGVESAPQTGAFEVGRDLPPNPIQLSANTTSSSVIALSWPFISVAGADSVRVWYNTAPIPVGVVDVITPFPLIRVDPGVTQATVAGLSPSTTYYFGAQVRISGDWTAVSTGSSATARTLDPDPGSTIPNTAVIDTAFFDSTRNEITVIWDYQPLPGGDIEWGCVYDVNAALVAGSTPATWHPADGQDTAVIQLGGEILFDTTYSIAVQMRKDGGGASVQTPNATVSVRVNGYSWEPIEYFREQTGDTVWAFNRHIALWYEGIWTAGRVTDTIRAVRLATAPQGMLPVGTPFVFSRYEHGPAITLAVGYDQVPPGYRPQDVRLYRRTAEGQWMVFHEHELLPQRGMVRVETRMIDIEDQVLLLMIDRVRPTAHVRGDVHSPVLPTTTLYDTLDVSDNTGNLSVSLVCSRAGNAPTPAQLDTLEGNSAVMAMTIPGGYVTEDDGVRAYVIVSDGLHHDTINVSRQVIRSQAS